MKSKNKRVNALVQQCNSNFLFFTNLVKFYEEHDDCTGSSRVRADEVLLDMEKEFPVLQKYTEYLKSRK